MLQRTHALLARSLVSSLFAFAPACSSGDASRSPAPPADAAIPALAVGAVSPDLHSHYRAAYTEETVVIDHATAASALRAISDDGATYTFDGGASKVAALAPGQILLLEGIALRKVESVARDGDAIVVTTSLAAITDAIEDGAIDWNGAVDFSAGVPASLATAGITDVATTSAAALRPLAEGAAPPTMSLSSKVGDYAIKVTFTPTKASLGIDATITRSLNGGDFTGKIKGNVVGLSTVGAILVSHRKLEPSFVSTPHVEGDFEMSWTGTQSESSGVSYSHVVKLPIGFQIPIWIAGIPFMINVETKFGITFALTAKQSSMRGAVHVHFTGAQQLSFGGDAAPSGDGLFQGDADEGEPPVASSAESSAISLTATVPKIGFGVGIQKAFFAGPTFSLVGTGTAMTPGALAIAPCIHMTTQIVGKAGFDASIGRGLFDLSFGSDRQLFSKETSFDLPKGARCDPDP